MADKKRDALTGMAYIKVNENQNSEKAPRFKGFVSVTPELLKVLSNLEPDDYGTVKIELALWTVPEQKGVLKGTAQLPYAVRKGDVKPKAESNDIDDMVF